MTLNDLYEETLAMESTWEIQQSCYSLGLDVSFEGPSMEALMSFNDIKQKILKVIKRIIAVIQKLFGLKKKFGDITITDKEKMKTIMIFINHYPQAIEYGNVLTEFSRHVTWLYTAKESNSAKTTEFRNRLRDLKDILAGEVPNSEIKMEKLVFNYEKMEANLNHLVKPLTQVQNWIAGSQDHPDNAVYTSAKASVISATSFFAGLCGRLAAVLQSSITTSDETKLLDSEILQTVSGINVVKANIGGKIAITYVPKKDEVRDKFGEQFIIVNPAYFTQLSASAKMFCLYHEACHVQLFKEGKDGDYKGLQKEIYCDQFALEKLGNNITKGTKALTEILQVALNMKNANAVALKGEIGARIAAMKNQKKVQSETEKNTPESEYNEQIPAEDTEKTPEETKPKNSTKKAPKNEFDVELPEIPKV